MHDDLPTAYDHTKHEQALYSMWEKAGAFQPQLVNSSKLIVDSKKTKNQELITNNVSPFTVIMPPPNANGSLHIGHAVFVTLEDIMVRYHRMKGEPTLWLPGADHAGFETQVVYQKKLEKEGKNWFTIPRDELYNEIKAFTLANKENMENQLRRLGASCDWTREKFTLDPEIIKIVYQTFKELHDDGLVYRDSRIINWCTKHQTTLSDLEVKHEERASELYEIKYELNLKTQISKLKTTTKNLKLTEKKYITVATTRPETMFGDVAVAVNPNDKKYQNLIGKTVTQPLTNRQLPVIADELVDMKFGTGALKITPAHDGTDYEIGKKHGLEMDHRVFDFFGKLDGEYVPHKYQGLKIDDARSRVVEDLEKLGLLTRKPYNNSVSTCYKCGRVIEPMVLPQWFIRMTAKVQSQKLVPSKPEGSKVKSDGTASTQSRNEGKSLQDLGIEAVKTGEVKFVTKKFEKIYLHWLENLRDWNISRQIVWGIRLPVFYCSNFQDTRNNNQTNSKSQSSNSQQPTANSQCQPIITDGEIPQKCPTCGDTKLTQDPDVFDTWFSSGQWTFAPLMTTNINHPDQKERLRDFETFYPTSVMETGHDILFFWVARMIMLGKYKTGTAPFKHVYLHGLVRDKDRQKMSKSKGNVVDPLGVIDQYGADALRMALVFGVSAGNDIVISEEKIKGMRNFSNKVWNVGRYVISQITNNNTVIASPLSVIASPLSVIASPLSVIASPLSVIASEAKQSNSNVGSPRHLRNSQVPRNDMTEADKKILQQLEDMEKSVKKDIENFHFHEAAQTLYQFIWHDFADVYIEVSKKQLENKDLSLNTCFILLNTVKVSLKLLHPFMPFVTEAVWQEMVARKLVDKDRLLINTRF